MLIALLVSLLPLQQADAAVSLDYELLGTHPQANAQPTDGKSLRKLQVFDNKIYAGYGDAVGNSGPVHLNPYDLDTNSFTGSVLNVPTEEINKFRIFGDKLVAPMLDKTGCAVCVMGYAQGPPFSNLTPVTAAHIFDINTLNGTDRWLVGSSNVEVDGAHVWRSENGVDGWEVVQAETNDPVNDNEQYRWIEVLNNKIYMQAGDVVDENWQQVPVRIFDGATWTEGTTDIVSSDGQTLVFNNKILSKIDGLSAYDGETVEEVTSFPGAIKDMYVDGEYLYILRTNATLTRTNNLEDWQELGPTVNDPSSIAVHDGVVYVGTYNATLYGSTTDLPEFEPDSTQVSGQSRVPPRYESKAGTYGIANIYPQYIAVDSNDNRYVVDGSNGNILKLDSSGNHVGTLDSSNMEDFDGAGEIYIDDNDNLFMSHDDAVRKYSLAGDLLLEFGSSGSGNGQFDSVGSITTDSAGNIYVVDQANIRIQKFNSNGVYQTQWGSEGTGDGEFFSIGDIAADSSNNVYALDPFNYRVQKFNSSGVYQTQWGSMGDGDTEFFFPNAIAVDSTNDVLIADRDLYAVKRFSSSGVFEDMFGTNGTGDGEFENLNDIAVDSNDSIFAVDSSSNTHRVLEFQSNGTYVSYTDTQLDQPGKLYNPFGVAAASDGSVYVADTGNHRIQKFDEDDEFELKWGNPGSGNGEFSGPSGVTIGPDGNIYVADTGNHRIQKFSANGTYISQFGSSGSGNGQFSSPLSVRFDEDGNMYVVEFEGNNRIQKFDEDGNYISKFGTTGNGAGELYGPRDLAFDSDGNIYIAEQYNNRIQKFDSNGNYIAQWGYPGDNNGEFSAPNGIVIDSHNNVYVADSNNHRIQKFTRDGIFLTKFGTTGLEDNEFQALGGIAIADDNTFYITDQGYGDTTAVKKFSYNVTDRLSSGDILVEAPYATNLTCSDTVTESSLDAQDPNKEYPLGLVDFCLEVTEGSTHTMSIIFKTDLSVDQVVARKYDPNGDAYDDLPGAVLTATTLGGDPAIQITYDITDGGALDTDGLANGEILDPVGLALARSSSAEGNGSDVLVDTGQATNLVLLVAGLLLLGGAVLLQTKGYKC